MAVLVRAIYEKGQIRLLDEIELLEGEQLQLTIEKISEDDLIREALADMDIDWADPTANPYPEVEGLEAEIFEALRGCPHLSDSIMEERRLGL